jgi:hypothetical protein
LEGIEDSIVLDAVHQSHEIDVETKSSIIIQQMPLEHFNGLSSIHELKSNAPQV